MQKITTFLWFNDQAEEAAKFYTSLFKNARIVDTKRYGKGTPMPEGGVMTVTFEVDGQQFIALNGGPHFTFTPAVSLFVNCEDQAEVDRLWNAMTTDGGQESMCGWLVDKYGLSWQIVPKQLGGMMSDPNREKANRVTAALMQMKKLDLPALERAYEGK